MTGWSTSRRRSLLDLELDSAGGRLGIQCGGDLRHQVWRVRRREPRRPLRHHARRPALPGAEHGTLGTSGTATDPAVYRHVLGVPRLANAGSLARTCLRPARFRRAVRLSLRAGAEPLLSIWRRTLPGSSVRFSIDDPPLPQAARHPDAAALPGSARASAASHLPTFFQSGSAVSPGAISSISDSWSSPFTSASRGASTLPAGSMTTSWTAAPYLPTAKT